MEQTNEQIAWSFVEKYYPNYYSCNEIAKCEDLCKLLNEEHEDGDDASQLLDDEYNGDLNNGLIQADYDNLMNTIYEKSIVEFVNKRGK